MYWKQIDISDKRLSSIIKIVLVNRSIEGQTALPPVIRIFPETEISLFLDFNGKFTSGNQVVNGAINGLQNKYYYLAMSDQTNSDKMIISFYPGGLRHFTSIPLSSFRNKLVSILDIGEVSLKNLFEQLGNLKTTRERMIHLEKELVKLIQFPARAAGLSHHIAENISQKGRLLTRDELDRVSSLGARQIQRYFLDDIGINMKRYLNISRFQKSRHLIQDHNRPIIEAMLSTGYYDQPHFTRDYKNLSGLTPGEFAGNFDLCSKSVPEINPFFTV